MEANVFGLLAGLIFLATIRVILSRRGVMPSLRTSLIGASIGAIVYPLVLCTFMGMVASRLFVDDHGWTRFKYAFSIYAQAAVTDSIPRGAVMGLFAMTCLDFLRRKSAARANQEILKTDETASINQTSI